MLNIFQFTQKHIVLLKYENTQEQGLSFYFKQYICSFRNYKPTIRNIKKKMFFLMKIRLKNKHSFKMTSIYILTVY